MKSCVRWRARSSAWERCCAVSTHRCMATVLSALVFRTMAAFSSKRPLMYAAQAQSMATTNAMPYISSLLITLDIAMLCCSYRITLPISYVRATDSSGSRRWQYGSIFRVPVGDDLVADIREQEEESRRHHHDPGRLFLTKVLIQKRAHRVQAHRIQGHQDTAERSHHPTELVFEPCPQTLHGRNSELSRNKDLSRRRRRVNPVLGAPCTWFHTRNSFAAALVLPPWNRRSREEPAKAAAPMLYVSNTNASNCRCDRGTLTV